MELGIIIAISGATLTIVGSIFGMIFWCRGEINGVRKDLSNTTLLLRDAIHEMKLENKDFHFRLLEIERERNKIIKLP